MDSLESMSLAALGLRLKEVFCVGTQPVEYAANDRLHLYQMLSRRKSNGLSYPILAYALSSISESDTASPSVAMIQSRRTVVRGDTVGSLYALPVTLSIDVTYLDTDRSRLLLFMSRWLLAQAKGSLNFTLKYDGIPVDVQVKPDTTLTAPQREMAIDVVNQYEFSGQLTMRTYVTGPFETAVKDVPLIRYIDIGLAASAFMDEKETSDYPLITPNENDVIRYVPIAENPDNALLNIHFEKSKDKVNVTVTG